MSSLTLEERISKTSNYAKRNKFCYWKKQHYIADALYRHITSLNMDDIKTIDCIKGFYKDKKCMDRLEEIKDNYDWGNKVSENVKILFMKAIYMEKINKNCNNH